MTVDTIVLFGKQVHRDALKEFKRRYLAARALDIEVFIYDGQEVLTQFAKYLVEHAENQMGVL